MGFEDEVEQSLGRPCRQRNGRSKRTCELTSSIVPRGTSFHRSVEFKIPSIGFDPARFSCCCRGLFPGPAELGALVFTISLKRSTQNLQLTTSSLADYPIFWGHKADIALWWAKREPLLHSAIP